MLTEIGDVVQIDGGLVIVTSIKGDRANIAPVSEFKGRRPHALDNGINIDISRDRLFERRGEAGLADFLKAQAEAKDEKRKGKIKPEPGDILCYQGRVCTVLSVDASGCAIGDLDGNEWRDGRWLSEFFFQDCTCHKLVRLNADERAANLKQFLSQRKSPLLEAETSDEVETQHIETMRATATPQPRTRKRAAKSTAKATAKPAEAKTPKPAAKEKLFGFGTVRVVQAAGKSGVEFEKLKAFLTAKGFPLSDSTIKQNMNKGKNGIEGMAILDKAQLAEINA
jgi:hypothetical protein